MSEAYIQQPDGRWLKKPNPQNEPESVGIYYMRDNHTFRRLPLDVCAAIEILSAEFAEGNVYGMLCGKPNGVVDTVVHARDGARWPEFESAARAWLEDTIALSKPPIPSELIEERIMSEEKVMLVDVIHMVRMLASCERWPERFPKVWGEMEAVLFAAAPTPEPDALAEQIIKTHGEHYAALLMEALDDKL